MDWTQPIDGYCERVGPDFWAEPLNAVSNLAFLLAAGLAYVVWKQAAEGGRRERRAVDAAGFALIIVVVVIGIGSFLFHTFANRWSSLADVLPIAVFIYGYFALALHRLLGLGRILASLGTLAFLGLSFVADDVFGPVVGPSSGYVPALLALVVIGLLLVLGRGPQGPLVLGAGLVFTVSLSMRIADGPVCEAFPLGTHFLWHILNATTLGLLLVAAVREGPRRGLKRITP
ncbi:MAG: hypothetical protein H7Y08_05760 [Rhizobiaceae bacterium]|nr:hypothetical protein [Rhizobiaceae bacterium]